MFPTVLDSLPAVVSEPFPHVVVRNAIPEHLYARLEHEYPPLDRFGTNHGNNKRVDLPSKRMGNYSELWQAFIAAHVSQRFWATLWDIFGGAIKREFPERNVDPNGTVDGITNTTTVRAYYWPRWREFTRP